MKAAVSPSRDHVRTRGSGPLLGVYSFSFPKKNKSGMEWLWQCLDEVDDLVFLCSECLRTRRRRLRVRYLPALCLLYANTTQAVPIPIDFPERLPTPIHLNRDSVPMGTAVLIGMGGTPLFLETHYVPTATWLRDGGVDFRRLQSCPGQ